MIAIITASRGGSMSDHHDTHEISTQSNSEASTEAENAMDGATIEDSAELQPEYFTVIAAIDPDTALFTHTAKEVELTFNDGTISYVICPNAMDGEPESDYWEEGRYDIGMTYAEAVQNPDKFASAVARWERLQRIGKEKDRNYYWIRGGSAENEFIDCCDPIAIDAYIAGSDIREDNVLFEREKYVHAKVTFDDAYWRGYCYKIWRGETEPAWLYEVAFADLNADQITEIIDMLENTHDCDLGKLRKKYVK